MADAKKKPAPVLPNRTVTILPQHSTEAARPPALLSRDESNQFTFAPPGGFDSEGKLLTEDDLKKNETEWREKNQKERGKQALNSGGIVIQPQIDRKQMEAKIKSGEIRPEHAAEAREAMDAQEALDKSRDPRLQLQRQLDAEAARRNPPKAIAPQPAPQVKSGTSVPAYTGDEVPKGQEGFADRQLGNQKYVSSVRTPDEGDTRTAEEKRLEHFTRLADQVNNRRYNRGGMLWGTGVGGSSQGALHGERAQSWHPDEIKTEDQRKQELARNLISKRFETNQITLPSQVAGLKNSIAAFEQLTPDELYKMRASYEEGRKNFIKMTDPEIHRAYEQNKVAINKALMELANKIPYLQTMQPLDAEMATALQKIGTVTPYLSKNSYDPEMAWMVANMLGGDTMSQMDRLGLNLSTLFLGDLVKGTGAGKDGGAQPTWKPEAAE